MNSTIKQTIGIGLIVTILSAGILWGVLNNFQMAFGAAPSGLQASVATTSVNTVTNTPSLVFATSTCSSRIISTTASPIMVTFADNGVITSGVVGNLQNASTTEVYDSGLYGCGALRVFSFVSGTITVTEIR